MEKNKNIIARDLLDELMLFDSDSDNLHVLNQSARLIYTLYKEGKNIHEIALALKHEFRVKNESVLENDIKKCIKEFEEKGLMVS